MKIPGFSKTQGMDDLVNVMKKKGFLTSSKVEQAIRKTPRHFFIPSEYADEAYEDKPIPTKNLQTISQPSVVAKMTEWLDVSEGNNILEIGGGSGWQSAILSQLVGNKTIFAVERFENIIEFAKNNLSKVGITNIEFVHGDGSLGLPEKAPFDRIIVTAACKEIPKPLIDQLAIDGLIIAPVGTYMQEMILYRKTTEGLKIEKQESGYVFVPLIGKYGFTKEKNSVHQL